MIQAGKLDRSIVIEEPTQGSPGGIGERAETWTTKHACRAQVISVSGNEVLKAGAERAVRVARFIVRWVSVVETDRVVYDGLNWTILHLRELGRREGLEILAEVVK